MLGAIGPSACCRHPDHYRRVRHSKAEAKVERGSHTASQLGTGAVKRAILAIQVHRLWG